MTLKIVQAGHPVLRQAARPLGREEIRDRSVQDLIAWMRETMNDAPGVGLAAPQVGVSIQLAVIEDREELMRSLSPERLAERSRRPVPFHVLVNPVIERSDSEAEFFEGCLSLAGYTALTPRSTSVRVRALNHRGDEVDFMAFGWHARIVQHEVDHLHGRLYIDGMRSRSFTSIDNMNRYWSDMPVQEAIARLGVEA